MNGYKAFYNGKTKDVWAETSRDAQMAALQHFQIGSRRKIKPWDLTVVLAEKNGEPVLQTTNL